MGYSSLTGGLTILVPDRGQPNWDSTVLSGTWNPISTHDHTGSGKGLQIATAAILANAVDDTLIRLRNAQWLRARNAANSADKNILRINSSDMIEFDPSVPILGQNNLGQAYNQGGAGAGRVINAISGQLEVDGAGIKTQLINGIAVSSFATSGSTFTVDFSANNYWSVVLQNATVTFNFTNPPGPGVFFLILQQDSTGGRQVIWPGTVAWSKNITPKFNTNPNSYDIITFIYDGTNYEAYVSHSNYAKGLYIPISSTLSLGSNLTVGLGTPVSFGGAMTKASNQFQFLEIGDYEFKWTGVGTASSAGTGVSGLRIQNVQDSVNLFTSSLPTITILTTGTPFSTHGQFNVPSGSFNRNCEFQATFAGGGATPNITGDLSIMRIG